MESEIEHQTQTKQKYGYIFYIILIKKHIICLQKDFFLQKF